MLQFVATAPAAVVLNKPHLHHHADGFLLRREGVPGQRICGVQHQGVDAFVTQAAAAVQPVLPPAHNGSSGMTPHVSCWPRQVNSAARELMKVGGLDCMKLKDTALSPTTCQPDNQQAHT
jgi:hypothetical protein